VNGLGSLSLEQIGIWLISPWYLAEYAEDIECAECEDPLKVGGSEFMMIPF